MDMEERLARIRVVVTLLACNLGVRSIAIATGLSEETVRGARRNIGYQKGDYYAQHYKMAGNVDMWLSSFVSDDVVRRIAALHPNALNGQGLHSGLWRRINDL